MKNLREKGVNGGFADKDRQGKRSEADNGMNAPGNFCFVLRLPEIEDFQQKRKSPKNQRGAEKLKFRRQRFVVKEGVADFSLPNGGRVFGNGGDHSGQKRRRLPFLVPA